MKTFYVSTPPPTLRKQWPKLSMVVIGSAAEKAWDRHLLKIKNIAVALVLNSPTLLAHTPGHTDEQ